ncbi:hypothetical protein SAMN05216410_0425 [Sanguibacter gelidistatuariae]|uniref:Uncharacterized protein n=1 Tax=Sanguibacter gelidistatuariae TaxID=1814289 RepID=A0A1G6GSA2_9MICO|nr:hypothetical protein [Sanguibacter gelidistatuariae]SDB84858.1 hypothetical protein SAMN05216410_0425 [Sanguibacter gelidistatuariae]
MNPAAKKCIRWSIGLFVVGALLLVYLPDIYMAINNRTGPNAELGLGFLTVALTLVQWTLMPVGASLIGAAVVIQVLAGETKHPAEDPVRDRNRNRNF